MPKLTPACRALAAAGLVAASTAAFAAPAPAQEEPAVAETAPAATDPYLWLEDVTGDKALGWAREQNARTDAELASAPGFDRLKADILAILDSDAKIPAVEKIGDSYYNF